MADLSERGQILLVAGFALAVTFVSLALVLNSVIYTENLATRSESTTAEPIAHVEDIQRATETLIKYINADVSTPSSTYSELEGNLTSGFDNVTSATARHQLAGGLAIDGSIDTIYRATWVRQTNETRNFTDASGAADWSPISSGAEGARAVRLFVADDASLDGSNPFTLAVEDDAGNAWDVSIDSTNVVTADGTTCSHTASSFWVNVSEGTVGGSDCPGLQFAPDIGEIDSIEFLNAENVTGMYRVLVNKSTGSLDPAKFGTSPDDPFRQTGLYGAVVTVEVEQASLVYRTSARSEPGEHDE